MASAAQQFLRDAEIRAAHAAGESTAALVARLGLSKSRVKQIISAEPPPVEPVSGAIKLAEERRAAYHDLLDEARAFTTMIPETQAAAKIGGYRLVLDGLDRLTSLEQKLGYLPTDLGELGHKRDFAQKVLDILVGYDVPAEARKAILTVLEADSWAS